MSDQASQLRDLPSVDAVLEADASLEVLAGRSRAALAAAVRSRLTELRSTILEGGQVDPAQLTASAVATEAAAALDQSARPRLVKVINATGVVLHTNLGRAVLAPEAISAAVDAATGACNLEYDVATGKRGDRDNLVVEHLLALTGAEAATIVNNNAAAVILALNTLADGAEAIVSRGELIEIGGSFRIPDIMAKSGAKLREVGTTNRTHPADYERAITPDTAVLLKVHTSNYRIMGFSSEVELPELATIAAGHPDVVLMEDLGAGALIDLTTVGLDPEPIVSDRITAGADIVTFSGDKLLGGPQCGIIVGRRDLIDRIRRNPLKRALRCDKMTLAALEATLRLYRFSSDPVRDLPVLQALARPVTDLRNLGERAAAVVAKALGPDFLVEVVDTVAEAGSGSQPGVGVPSIALAITGTGQSPDRIATRFRRAQPSIVGRIEDGRFLLDLRWISDVEELVPHGVSTP